MGLDQPSALADLAKVLLKSEAGEFFNGTFNNLALYIS